MANGYMNCIINVQNGNGYICKYILQDGNEYMNCMIIVQPQDGNGYMNGHCTGW